MKKIVPNKTKSDDELNFYIRPVYVRNKLSMHGMVVRVSSSVKSSFHVLWNSGVKSYDNDSLNNLIESLSDCEFFTVTSTDRIEYVRSQKLKADDEIFVKDANISMGLLCRSSDVYTGLVVKDGDSFQVIFTNGLKSDPYDSFDDLFVRFKQFNSDNNFYQL